MMLSRIKFYRMRQGLLQIDVAHRVGVTESTMSKIETGRLKPSDKLMSKLARVLSSPAADGAAARQIAATTSALLVIARRNHIEFIRRIASTPCPARVDRRLAAPDERSRLRMNRAL